MKFSNLLVFIFISFFKISLFVIGGGFAMIPVIEDVFCNKNNLLKQEEILDMITVTQVIPGLTAINSAIFVGHKLAGIKGAIIATLGVVLPSLIIVSAIALIFSSVTIDNPHAIQALSCVRACVASLFCVIAYRIGKTVLNSVCKCIIVALFAIALILGVSPIVIILSSISIGIVYAFLQRKIKTEKTP